MTSSFLHPSPFSLFVVVGKDRHRELPLGRPGPLVGRVAVRDLVTASPSRPPPDG